MLDGALSHVRDKVNSETNIIKQGYLKIIHDASNKVWGKSMISEAENEFI